MWFRELDKANISYSELVFVKTTWVQKKFGQENQLLQTTLSWLTCKIKLLRKKLADSIILYSQLSSINFLIFSSVMLQGLYNLKTLHSLQVDPIFGHRYRPFVECGDQSSPDAMIPLCSLVSLLLSLLETEQLITKYKIKVN